MSKYIVDLKDLAHDKVSLQGSLKPGEIDFSLESVRQVEALEWRATAERAGEEIRIAGSLETTMELSCSRCLEPARTELQLLRAERARRRAERRLALAALELERAAGGPPSRASTEWPDPRQEPEEEATRP